LSEQTVQQKRTMQLLARYRKDLDLYARDCLKIRDKAGKVRDFPGFNSAQKHVHDALEKQLEERGFVRAIVLKGRQQGISTYTAIRYYRRATLHRGVNVYILSHEQSASDSLFKIVDRFQTNNPLRPNTGVANVKELEFDRLDSSYTVATAGQKAGGRSKTTSLFHGSEVAFWQSAGDHFASSVQTVPGEDGTEIILESTANGASGEFYERWQDAVAGVGDYIPVFIPWFWQEEYKRTVPDDFELSTDPGDTGISEKEYQKLFDLTFEQMAWRRAKIAELRSVQMFDQEYPASPDVAFQSADVKKSFILPILALRARKRKNVVGAGPLIIGADPSGPGKDRFSVAARQGLKVLWVEHRQMPVTEEAVAWLRAIIDDHLPDVMFVDLGNIGHAIVSLLKGLTDQSGRPAKAPDGRFYHEIVKGVNFGATSQSKLARPKVPGPKNRRAEMWDRSREWLELEDGVSIPDHDWLQAAATSPHKKPQLNNDFYLESKEQMKTRGVRSPDDWDAVALTFADSDRIVGSTARRESAGKKRLAEARTPAATPAGIILPPPLGGSDSWMG
jgi:hypothetical protein